MLAIPDNTVGAATCNVRWVEDSDSPVRERALRITSAAGTELSFGSYPAALTATNIVFEAAFPLGQ